MRCAHCCTNHCSTPRRGLTPALGGLVYEGHEMTNKFYEDPSLYIRFLDHIKEETDRGAVLSGAALLEEMLGELISRFLRNVKSTKDLLNGFNAPIGTFSARIKMAHSLGLITDEEYENIEKVRKIRNFLAHEWDNVSFDNQDLKSLCKSLRIMREDGSSTRDDFNQCIKSISIQLMFRIPSVKHLSIHEQAF